MAENIYKVEDFMDKTFLTLEAEMDVYHAIDLLLEKGQTSAVVVDDRKKIVGILSEKDCLKLLTGGSYYQMPSAKVKDFMTTEVFSITADVDIFKLADMFLSHYFRRIVVRDERNCMIGQITRRDLLRIIKELHLKNDKEERVAPIL